MDVNAFRNHPKVYESQLSSNVDFCLLLSVLGIILSQSAAGNAELDLDKAKADLTDLEKDCSTLDLLHTLILHLLSALPHRLRRLWLGRDSFCVEPTFEVMEALMSMVGEKDWRFIKTSRGGNLNICWIETVMWTMENNQRHVLNVSPVRKCTYIARHVRKEDARMYWLNVSPYHSTRASTHLNTLLANDQSSSS